MTSVTAAAAAAGAHRCPTIGYSNGILYVQDIDDGDTDVDADGDADDGGDDAHVRHANHYVDHVDNMSAGEAEEAADDESDSSAASMETLSDNVSIWVDGEKHWVSGVDANTTCADLICALLNYLNGEQMFHADHADEDDGGGNVRAGPNASNVISQTNKNGSSRNGNNAINQSTTIATTTATTTATITNTKEISKTKPITGTPSAATALACEYVIVKQHRHCEEYLDGSTKVFDVLPARDVPAKKECELLLRRLVSTPHLTTQVSSLLSTDKDSGMGSPVGSSRSARFRRRKHKSSNWLALGNTLHPKLSQRTAAAGGGGGVGTGAGGGTANERLVKIILAQDETIHRQLSLLREKERQISKIEVEKHRVRERELGKNYLLETYLNGLDEAAVEPDVEDGVEIFIDEPYHRFPSPAKTAPAPTTKRATQRHHKQQQHQQHKKFEQQHLHTHVDDIAPLADETDELGGNRKEIELKIHWLERVYALNKQLQREEELLLKLHAKIRKHQVRRAYQTKREVLQQIDKLDAELTLQCADIAQVEDRLTVSNEQLAEKLVILEKLSEEFLQAASAETAASVRGEAVAAHINKVAHGTASTANERRKADECADDGDMQKFKEGVGDNQSQHVTRAAALANEPVTPHVQPGATFPATMQMQQAPELGAAADLKDHGDTQKIITPPILTEATQAVAAKTKAPAPAASTSEALEELQQIPQILNMTVTPPPLVMMQMTLSGSNNYPISRLNHCAGVPATANGNYVAVTGHNTAAPISSSISDKNMLLPPHASNAKTVKKQMFNAAQSLNQAPPVSHQHTQIDSHKGSNCVPSLPPTLSLARLSTLPVLPLSPTPLDQNVDITRLGTLV